MLTTLRRMFRADSPRPRRPRPARARLGVEALEGRAVPAASPVGPAFDVATGLYTFDFEAREGIEGRTIARSDSGNFAETWNGVDGIYVRLYNGGGTPLTAALKVAGTTVSEAAPTIAMSPNGQFVVAWTHLYSYGEYDVRAQRYNASGSAVGGTIGIAQSGLDESQATAGMDAAGNFAVAYTVWNGSNYQDVRARQFNASGGYVRELVVANGLTFESAPSLDMNPAGQFVVSYTNRYGSIPGTSTADNDVWAKRYGPAGNLIATTPVALSSTASEEDSSAAIDDAGNVVVSYTRSDVNNNCNVYAQRVATSGLNLGAPIAMPLNGHKNDYSSVDMDHSGNFVVAYANFWYESGPYGWVGDVHAQQFGWNGAAQSGTIYVTNVLNAEEGMPSVAVGNGGNFVINYYYMSESTQDYTMSLRTRIYYTPVVYYPPPVFNPNPWQVYLP